MTHLRYTAVTRSAVHGGTGWWHNRQAYLLMHTQNPYIYTCCCGVAGSLPHRSSPAGIHPALAPPTCPAHPQS